MLLTCCPTDKPSTAVSSCRFNLHRKLLATYPLNPLLPNAYVLSELLSGMKLLWLCPQLLTLSTGLCAISARMTVLLAEKLSSWAAISVRLELTALRSIIIMSIVLMCFPNGADAYFYKFYHDFHMSTGWIWIRLRHVQHFSYRLYRSSHVRLDIESFSQQSSTANFGSVSSQFN